MTLELVIIPVTDIAAAVAEDPFHFGPEGKADGIDPQRQDHGSFAELPDPDGNVWLLQGIASRG